MIPMPHVCPSVFNVWHQCVLALTSKRRLSARCCHLLGKINGARTNIILQVTSMFTTFKMADFRCFRLGDPGLFLFNFVLFNLIEKNCPPGFNVRHQHVLGMG